ncbi:hypothetical protein [Mycolicibacterium llatzerense]|uniref:hypothetical protein n=1 Tax=Mycolicibacterium llatzerense TaxID=280871 RepID=UPI0021B5D6F0|nr:hypothetical protein [Mycolicibacterium llatzerense]MCT7371914.1 hypothetical protein [Mycolicibacterium llatzerense]
MTDRRPGKNNAAKSAARKIQRTDGVPYRTAHAAARTTRSINVSVRDLIGAHVGSAGKTAGDLLATLDDSTELVIRDADDLAAGPDQTRADLMATITAGAWRTPVRLVVTDHNLARRLVDLYPQVAATAGITVSVE